MAKKHVHLFGILSVFFLLFTACSLPARFISFLSLPTVETVIVVEQPAATPEVTSAPCASPSQSGLSTLTGRFDYTYDYSPERTAYSQAVSLLDMTGFVINDHRWTMPAEAQVLGTFELDYETDDGFYQISLPMKPSGALNDVDQDGQAEAGVQIFSVIFGQYWTSGPFQESSSPYLSWWSYIRSVFTDVYNDYAITGGKLLIWSPDDEQSFPYGFGDDGLLFTADDPSMPVSAGYSVIDLDQQPFTIIRDETAEITLYEPSNEVLHDYLMMSFTEAFDAMFEVIRKEYAFNGVEGKQPDWDALYVEFYPRVEAAQENRGRYDYYLALRDFALAFNDSHVSVHGGEHMIRYNTQYITGGYGLAVRELDDGSVMVTYVVPDSPAWEAGIQVGAQITAVDGISVQEAISQVAPFSPQSTALGKRYEQVMYLLRGEVRDRKTITFVNPGWGLQTVDLLAALEMDSMYALEMGGWLDEYVLPVEYDILGPWVGYIRIHSNSDDPNLSYRIIERALSTFKEVDVDGLIIDMRQNTGGSPLGVAGYLTDQEIEIAQLQYYSEETGQFEPEGGPYRIIPLEKPYHFDRMVLLVDQFCYSACEIESYALSLVPGMMVMGETPTAGVVGEVSRGSFRMPSGIVFTVPTGRYVLPDGSIFLEGMGVTPDIDLPTDAESVLSEYDTVIDAAVEYIYE